MVVSPRIFDQTLSGAPREGGDAIVNALAGHRRKPAIGYRELGGHVVVVIEKSLVVIAHRALTGEIGVLAATGARRLTASCVAFASVDKTILRDGACGS
jgi:hypothetical protein